MIRSDAGNLARSVQPTTEIPSLRWHVSLGRIPDMTRQSGQVVIDHCNLYHPLSQVIRS
jgi:hypothetical protein